MVSVIAVIAAAADAVSACVVFFLQRKRKTSTAHSTQHSTAHSTVHYNSCFICSVMGRVLLRTRFIPHGHKRYYVVHVYVYVCARHMCVVTICCVRLSFVPFTQYLSRVSNQLQQLRDTHTHTLVNKLSRTHLHTFTRNSFRFHVLRCCFVFLFDSTHNTSP